MSGQFRTAGHIRFAAKHEEASEESSVNVLHRDSQNESDEDDDDDPVFCAINSAAASKLPSLRLLPPRDVSCIMMRVWLASFWCFHSSLFIDSQLALGY